MSGTADGANVTEAQDNDSVKKTLLVAIILCVVCSVLVSSAAVFLKERQEQNKALDMKKNILLTAGLISTT
ncbi:MAG: hypothetical protein ACOCUH_00925, partial [Bacteriovoracia bacterium]